MTALTPPSTLPLESRPRTIIPRLSVMMFLEFAIQGAWLPLLFPFLLHHREIKQEIVGNILAVGAVGAMLSPLVAGQIADRYMNAERVMALLHFIGAAIVLRVAYATSANELYVLSFLYGILYTPTLALVNAISFRHLPDAGRDFGKVRVWGTAGWIAAGIAIGQWLWHQARNDKALQYAYMADAMKLSAILGVVLGVYCFTLPPTPPATGKQKFAPAEALKEICRQPLLTLFLLSFVVAALHAFFFARTADYFNAGGLEVAPDSWINKVFGVGGGGIMTVGQISELLVLALMPLVIPRVNRKVLFSIGLSAYALRFFAFAYLPYTWAIIPALALHGIVFGCFFFLVFITIDEYTTKDVRSSAQNVFNLIIFGFGVILGNWLSGRLGAWVGADLESASKSMTAGYGAPVGNWLRAQLGAWVSPIDWHTFYAVPGWITIACLFVLLVMYPNRAAGRGPATMGTLEPGLK